MDYGGQNSRFSGGGSGWKDANDGYFTPKNILNPQFIRSHDEQRRNMNGHHQQNPQHNLEMEPRTYQFRSAENHHEMHYDFHAANSQISSPKVEPRFEYTDLVAKRKQQTCDSDSVGGILSDLEPIDIALIIAFCLLSLFGIIGLLYLYL
ncbi:hypothetical protein WR25_18387 isoform A [Diploscapter pachys]|uniref:Uncharacterized protein n=3 Tax=Diploscapter pachys TaxID=2018661 RepID=A0A2A2JZG7_9BILA|nr:hypothetical protein WR25_18387 isoform A [Diploscapter pachys]